MSMDTWGGDSNTPISYNKWASGNANPVMNIDPTGQYAVKGNPDPSKKFCPWCVIPIIIGLGLLTSCSGATDDIWIKSQRVIENAQSLSEYENDPDYEGKAIKDIEFQFRAVSDEAWNFALVQFIKGDNRKLSDGSYSTGLSLGQRREINFPDWVIDSIDTDPVYGSEFAEFLSDPFNPRWRYDEYSGNEPIYGTTDRPTLKTGYKVSYDFQMCLYKMEDVPLDGLSTDVKDLMSKAIKCVSWEFKATKKDDGTVILNP